MGVLNKMNKPNENGRSMIEMLGVLAIIGVLSVGGIAGYSKAMEQFKINKTIDQIIQIATNIQILYANQKNNDTKYDELSGANLIGMGVIPDDMETSSNSYYTEIKHPFNGALNIQGHEDWGSSKPYQAFSIILESLPKTACVKLATYDWGSSSSSGLVSVSVNNIGCFSCDSGYVGCQGLENEYIATACPNGSSLSIPMPVAAAAKICKQGTQFTIKFK